MVQMSTTSAKQSESARHVHSSLILSQRSLLLTHDWELHSLSNQQHIDRAPVELIHERQTRQAMRSRVNASIANDCPSSMGDHATGPADLLPSAKHLDLEVE
jgi:hypothetical protein